ncbi:Uncharacterised protein [Streptococcus pneumoniae]|uniref:hypothetical protein n=1 Tax=Streptococcus agalactiae TaxID=1311 RepID=UPI0002329CFB|nr:hypothetical protein [Streptococcus agalactiae]EHG14715.1 hypothetical protein HMPREF9682_00120 [Streptococcus intermedius F0395]MDS2599005.1 hypothetical protein [Streptococcus pneumoniae]MDS2647463.1 hypothetical protein [Streptococcus pneumoniae]MDS3820044.1 hypothetical protein [Streptococcus pneumoniae]MDS4450229.1 hypothetical protein [Streptococcus pneumoniae]
MDLFSKVEVSAYLEEIKTKLENEISGLSDEQITTIDIDEWSEYFYSNYQIEPILVYVDQAELDISEVKIQEYNIWSKHNPYEQEYFLVDGYKITFKIPFYGESELFNLRPSSFILSRFVADKIVSPRNDSPGYLFYASQYKRNDLKGKEDIRTFVVEEFKSSFRSYLTMIENVNNDIKGFNVGLENLVKSKLELRKNKASDFDNIKKALQIPMNLKADAPNIRPLPLKKIRKIIKPKPKNVFVEPEYCISDSDYNNILNIIHNACSTMEATSRTFNKNNEEELRDFIISTLGTHYVDSVTGETFRKIGKTDIHVIFENKSAFIGECKIWHGIKKFTDAIEQVFGYSTWKDRKISLIIFNKDNKDFNSILDVIEDWMKANTKKATKENANMWKCLIHREESNSDIQIAIQVYDISV